jgi:hypothetical protein
MGELFKVRAVGDSGDGDPVLGADSAEEAAENWLEKGEDCDTEPGKTTVEVWSGGTQKWKRYTVCVEARLFYMAEAEIEEV